MSVEPKAFKKFSDSIADPLIKLNKAGGLGLVFIFVGLLFVVIAQFKEANRFSNYVFAVGIILILASFILFLIIQIKGPVKAKRIVTNNKEAIDELQELSLELTRFLHIVQSFSMKHLDKINNSLTIISPIISELPFIWEKIKPQASKMINASKLIVETVVNLEEIIKDVEKALCNGDFKVLSSYSKRIKNYTQDLNENLKK